MVLCQRLIVYFYEMNEKVVLLFILGMGAVRLYEDYVDEVDRDDDEEEDRFKKRKISRRDVDNEPVPPYNTFETVVEVQLNNFSPKLMSTCSGIGPENCTCSRLFCYGGSCQKLEKFHQESKRDPRLCHFLEFSSFGLPIWVKICRQTVLWGQNLCECRRYLSDFDSVRNVTPNFVNGETFLP
uniref:EGF-like domain-containing protein n=1 Tax=Mesocestoides corti TaxID=53468 RepID=A0A5K3FTY5_MESCO